MIRQFAIVFTLLCLSSFSTACSGRRPSVPIGEIPRARPLTASEEAYGHKVFVELSRRYAVDYNDPRLDNITKIVERLTHAAGADQNPWHVYLFRAGEVKNAGATRGNHVFVWSGLLDFVQSDDELATIIGHELAHVLAGHTDPDPDEEIKKMLIGIGSLAAGVAVSAVTGATIGVDLGGVTSAVTEQVGQGLLVNPYSKELEREADQIGLFLMADAGFNPQAAIEFWSRARGSRDFQSGPAFFSSHPGTEERLAALSSLLPQASERFNQSRSSTARTTSNKGTPNTIDRYYAERYGYGTPKILATLPPDKPNISGNTADSFDWSGGRTGGSQGNKLSEFRITAFRGILYQDASTRSRPVGEFRRGARVQGKLISPYWVKIEQPDRGYLRLEDLKPTS